MNTEPDRISNLSKQNLFNVLDLHGIRATTIRIQVLRIILTNTRDEFTGTELLKYLRKDQPAFRNQTVFDVLTVFCREGLIAKKPRRNNKRGRPILAFSMPPLVRLLFEKTEPL
jgi:Fe2+ or Zn2+ uptake regulation protein